MEAHGDPRKRLHPVKLFLPSELSDFDIAWGSEEEWWCREEKVRGTTAEEPLDVLALYWKYAWNTARCPWLMPQFVQQVTKTPQMAERFWEMMLKTSESQLTIIGTQVMAYSGFYFAYEHFVTKCYAAKTGDTSPLLSYKQIKDALTSAFGAAVESRAWSDERMERIRRVRNDLAHNGGHPGGRTKELAFDMIIEGHLAVTPHDIAEAFAELKTCVDLLLEQSYPKVASASFG